MADFDQLREQLRQTRSQRDQAGAAAAAAQERLKRIAAAEAELNRVFNPDIDRHVAERDRLRGERQRAEAEIKRHRAERATAAAAEAGIITDFGIFTDPRQGIEQLKDSIPILLMPVRLETRFKSATLAGAPAAVPQLWVRIYPDDCWIDSFDPVLTANEVDNARTYWAGVWKAGGIEDQERAAWRTLALSHGSGRATWIVQQFQPVNLPAKPTKPRPQDVILTIATETPLVPAEEAATVVFWRDSWLADGDAARVALVQATFESAVGAARAAEIAGQYVPANFLEALPEGVTKPDVNLSVAFVVFASVETKQSAWSQAPKATILPDRFVFLGYENAGDTTPVVEIGRPVPSPLLTGPDPTAPEAEQLKHDAAGNLVVPDELKWISDFDRAVEVGMGMRINLSPTQARLGFARVIVIGLRLNADEQAAKTELETLFHHHAFSRTGLAILPQGTPTSNTEAAGSGFDRLDNPDESFEDKKQPLFTPQSGWLDKRDGQWIAEYLGIDPALFQTVHAAGASDQLTARAMNTALWPATLGYWMESMMAPVFPREAIERTREFFNRYVIGGGACPAIRIGYQPYGILPATAISRMQWLNQDRDEVGVFSRDPLLRYLRRLYPILMGIDQDFRAMLPEVSYVGKSGDPHALLLDIVGLHPASVEWSQRYAESLATVYNRLNLLGLGIGGGERVRLAIERVVARAKLVALGYSGENDPPILDLVFNGRHNRLKGGVVDDVPLSETAQIRAYTAAGDNYIQWLIDAANTSLDAVYQQKGFLNDKTPGAILYLMLRHAVQLGYHDTSIRLYESAGLFTAEMAAKARSDDPFLHIRVNQQVSESRYQPLYAVSAEITGSATVPVHQFIATQLTAIQFAFYLREQLAAMARLKTQPTARLERAFADHVDCCAYRLDAWLLGIVNYQLALMRNLRDEADTPARQGIYLGAWAYLEDVAPEQKVLTPVRLTDPELAAVFQGPGEPPLMRDSANQGYVHAPSLNHAVAAAVLRNGFISNASPENRKTMSVNLTSERARTGLAMLEGIRAGQRLSDLLGYQFERGLHDRHNLAEVDKFIYKLRKAFPLRADRMQPTKTGEGVSIEAIEARNVVNGLALVEHIKATNNKTYPFGKSGLPPTDTQAEADAINGEVDRLLESHDAVADLALAEGVYQAVLGNYDRVASTYDAYARGNFPPEPEVIRTPSNAIGLTHRVGVHLEAGTSAAVSPISGLAMSPRAQAEPALNRWLAGLLPLPENVGCVVAFREAATGNNVTREVTLRQLGLQPADWIVLIRDDDRQAMTEFDDRVVRFAVTNFAPRPDVPVAVRYMEKQAAPFSVFELMPLIRYLRRLTTKSRPLQATDLALSNEAKSKQDSRPFFDKARLDLVRSAMQGLRNDLDAFRVVLEGPLGDLENRRGEILTDVDQYIDDLTALLARAATFSIPQAGWGFAYDFRRRTYAAILDQAAALVLRWNDRIAEFQARRADAAAAATDEEKFAFLTQAERAISTIVTTPLPATPAQFENDLVTLKLPPLEARRDSFDDLRDTTRSRVSDLLSDVQALLPVSAFDFQEYSLTAHEDEMVRFAEDAVRLAQVMIAGLDRRLAASQDLFDEHDASADLAARVRALENAAKALLGPDQRIFPEFELTASHGDELENALSASQSRDLFQYLENPPEPERDPLDFPEDTWLYGVARVREQMHAWEQTVMFTGALGRAEPQLRPMQLPFIPDDRWLALEFPPEQKLDTDRLLYTAHFAAVFNKAARQCGMLVDEWTEVIPASTVDTGITFHHDRPNCEAPQTMLLATPAQFRGRWQWQDLVDGIIQTVEFAKRRAIEPKHIDASPYAPFLPATVVATQVRQLTIALDYALNNNIQLVARD
jgi:hypothetical protein